VGEEKHLDSINPGPRSDAGGDTDLPIGARAFCIGVGGRGPSAAGILRAPLGYGNSTPNDSFDAPSDCNCDSATSDETWS
jgi:hypothetical protein